MSKIRISATEIADEISTRLNRGNDPRGILGWLTGVMGFTWVRDRDPQRLRGAGVNASCTAGPRNLLANWCAAAKRKAVASAPAYRLRRLVASRDLPCWLVIRRDGKPRFFFARMGRWSVGPTYARLTIKIPRTVIAKGE